MIYYSFHNITLFASMKSTAVDDVGPCFTCSRYLRGPVYKVPQSRAGTQTLHYWVFFYNQKDFWLKMFYFEFNWLSSRYEFQEKTSHGMVVVEKEFCINGVLV